MPRPRALAGHEDEVVDRYRAGESAASIGADFGITYPPVLRVLKDAGVQMRPKGPYRRPLAGRESTVSELYEASLSLRDIAVLFDCSVIAVKGALAREGTPLRARGSHATRNEINRRRQVVAELSETDSKAMAAIVGKLKVRAEGGRPPAARSRSVRG